MEIGSEATAAGAGDATVGDATCGGIADTAIGGLCAAARRTRSRNTERLPHATGKKMRSRCAGPDSSYSKPYVAGGISTSNVTRTLPPEYHVIAFRWRGIRTQSGRCVCVATRNARYSAGLIPASVAAVDRRPSLRAMLIWSSESVVFDPSNGAVPSSAITVGAERLGAAVIATMSPAERRRR